MKNLLLYHGLFFVVLFVSCLGITPDLSAQVEIPAGNVSGTWVLANSPYQINGHITVPNDSILTIEPGVKIIFKGSYKVNVKGCVLAAGTVTDTITFTAENPSVGWQGVKFLNTSETNDTSRFIYCKMEYGKLDKAVGMDRAGGAVFAMNFSKLVISHCLLQNNLVYNSGGDQDGYGGAIMLWTSSPIITDNTIINNECIGSNSGGGAIMCWANSNAVISGNRISGNKATLGGGFYIGASAPILTNNIITDNQASYRAGGLRFYQGAKPVLINNIIAFNKGGDGGGINCLENSDPVFINTILYGNTGTNGSQVCILTADSDPDFIYCTVEGGKEGFGGIGAGANYGGLYENNINADPDFVNAETGDFHLSDNSPCISAGAGFVEINTKWYGAPKTDYEGNPRPNPSGTIPDMGAFENAAGMEDTTGLSGNVSGTWTYENSPYKVNGDITIPDGKTLTIEPGVQVVFTGHYKFNVQGRLLAMGTKQDTIAFFPQDTSIGWHGIRFRDTPGTNDSSKIIFCSLKYGKANSGDDYDRCGGALFVKGFGKLLVSNCLFSNNMNSGNLTVHAGGAIGILSCSPVIENSTISHNKAVANHGGGICIAFNAAPVIRNNVICRNQASGGAGLFIYQSNPLLFNNTIVYNHSDLPGSESCHGGAACIMGCSPTFINTIIFGNTATVGKQFNLNAGAQPGFYHCDIEGGRKNFSRDIVGGGSFSGVYESILESNPLFSDLASEDYRLSDDSPCISAGGDSVEVNSKWYYAPSTDYNGNHRPNPAGTRPDQGAIENINGFSTGLSETMKSDEDEAILSQNYPNPFTTVTEIPFSLPYQAPVKLQVLDCLGRVVSVLAEEELPQGEYRASFDARELPGGLYFIQLITVHSIQTRKCMIIRK